MRPRLVLLLIVALTGSACAPAEQPLRVAASASLRPLVVSFVDLHAATMPGVAIETHFAGSPELAESLATGEIEADLAILADEALFGLRLQPGWADHYVRFARDRLVVALAVGHDGGDGAAGPDAWEQRLRDLSLTPGIVDPAHHSAGYRALLALRLYDRLNPEAELEALVRRRLVDAGPAANVEALVDDLRSGRRDLAIVYGLTARAAGLDILPLPDDLDLGEPRLAATYSRVSYEPYAGSPPQPGAPIVFAIGPAASAARHPATLEFLRTLLGESGRAAAMELGLEPVLGADRPVGFVLPDDVEAVLEATGS